MAVGFKAETAGRIMAVVEDAERSKPSLSGQPTGNVTRGGGFWGQIIGSVADSTYRWRYSVKRVTITDNGNSPPTITATGDAHTAWNTIEIMNGNSGVLGTGVDASLLATNVTPAVPAPAGAIVRIFIDGGVWMFQYENSGTCSTT